tara:strand:- start:25 stop:210 length:186 start_codon:yes stop_codon:yes gene_type:complete
MSKTTWKNIIKDKAIQTLLVILLGVFLLFKFDLFVYPFGSLLILTLIIARILFLQGKIRNE